MIKDKGDSDRNRNIRRADKPRPTGTARVSRPAGPTGRRSVRDPDATRDRSSTTNRTGAASLDRDPETTDSNPSAAREVTRRQSRVAAALTGGWEEGPSSSFDSLAAEERGDTPAVHYAAAGAGQTTDQADEVDEVGEVGEIDQGSETSRSQGPAEDDRALEEKLDHLVDNPIEEEQRTDLDTPPVFQAGSPAPPPVPDFSGQSPTSTRELPTGGTEQTFVQNGVTYTRTTRPDGSVNTSYEQDGVDYSSTTNANGGSSVLISDDTDSGLHTRTITTTADGQVTDTSHSTQAVIDPSTGDITQQSRQETLGPDGVRTVNETVVRPDGGRATTTRTQRVDGSFEETYSYEGDDGTVNRTTTGAADGSSQTRRERSYTSDQPLEELLDAPPVPEGASNVVPLPEEGRSPTQIHDVVVTTTNPSGWSQTEYEERTVSQSSSDVQVTGTGDPETHNSLDTFPFGVVPDPAATSVTHSVSTVSSRDPVTGQMVTTTGGAQTLTLAGERHPDFPIEGSDGQVSVTRVDSWNSDGGSATSYSSRGFTEYELLDQAQGQADRSSDVLEGFRVRVGDSNIAAGPPDTGKSIYDHLNMKGGGDAQDWLGAGGDDLLDVDVTVVRDSEGHETQQNITWSTVDENGNGRVVTRSQAEGSPVGWVYTDLSNDGQDYRRQTVFEGTKISVYEERTQTGPGTFEAMSETTDDGVVIASTSSSRRQASEDELRGMLSDGEITQGQLDRLLSDGPPYYVSRALDNTEPLLDDDGNLRTDDDGNPIQTGHHVSSLEVEGSDGYSVSEHYRIDYGETPSEYTDSRLRTTTDPTGDPPYQATIENRENGQVTDAGTVQVDVQGRLTYNGQELGQYDLQGTDIASLVRDKDGFDPLSAISPSVRAAQLVPEAPGGRLRLSADDARFRGLGYIAEAVGIYSGARSLWGGIADGDARQILEGVGGLAGGVESVAAATSALANRVGLSGISQYADEVSAVTKAGRFGTGLGRSLGAVGGFIQAGFGVYDFIHADSTHDRVAAGLNVAAGAVAVGSAFFGPPGWVVGGLIAGGLSVAAFFVGGGDDNATLGIDERMQ